MRLCQYAEVKEKQRNVDAVQEREEVPGRAVWVGFTCVFRHLIAYDFPVLTFLRSCSFKPRARIDEQDVLGAKSSIGHEEDDDALQVMF